MTARLAIVVALVPVFVLGYAYLIYPLSLIFLGWLRRYLVMTTDPDDWPLVTLTVPAYNEVDSIGSTIERLLAVDYPRDRLQIVVVSDCSNDGTDEVVRRYADQGVELVRCHRRMGKTGAENSVVPHLRGDIIVNTDASVEVMADAIRPIVRAFGDPTVGVASGFDVSVGSQGGDQAQGESGYVGYEMWVRSHETRAGSIVGASGCLYGIRRSLLAREFPASLSRDFAAALIAREHGFRAVSVPDAVCLVPRSTSLERELSRKTRTMARGLRTLWFKRRLLNPSRYGVFAYMLFSHKLCRWLVQPVLLMSGILLVLLTPVSPLAAMLVAAGAGGVAVCWLGWRRPTSRWRRAAGFAVGANVAALRAWSRVLRRAADATWEPTRRSPLGGSAADKHGLRGVSRSGAE